MGEQPDWTRAYKLMGTYNGESLAIAVDENGKLYALLQGTYDSELRTVKLDDEGRISAFIIDSTDAWGTLLNIGNAELAARLGSIVSYDRRGTVYKLEDFENGLIHVDTTTDGLGSTITLSPTQAVTGGYSLAANLAATIGRFCSINLLCDMPSITPVGFSVSFRPGNDKMYFQWQIVQHTDTVRASGMVRLDGPAEELYYFGSDNAWHKFADCSIVQKGGARWYYGKLVVDTPSEKYTRFMIGANEYDLSAYELYTATPIFGPVLFPTFYVENRQAVAGAVHIDDMVVTAAEP